jgi:very-short-patch-repair endonuclease
MKVVSFEYPMYYGAKPSIFKKAKELRKQETETEKIIWSKIDKNQILGLSFRRQHPINQFIADFYCHKIKLVIEIDGGIHNLPENKIYDIERSEILKNYGIKVIRFSNEQVKNNIEDVIQIIKKYVQSLLSEAQKSPVPGDLGGLKSSTLIEGIVAMVIILTCATIGFTALTKQKKGINSALRVEAEMNISYIVAEAKQAGKLLDNSFDYENMRIDMQIVGYQKYTKIKLLICEAFTPQNEKICDYREIVEIK